MYKEKNSILICGAFDFNGMSTGGQPVKTRELYKALKNSIGEENIIYVDTVGWKKHPVSMIRDFFGKASKARDIIMLPAHKGVTVFSRLLVCAKRFFKCKIFYDVVGGWLPNKLKTDRDLLKQLKKFDGIWDETTVMDMALKQLGLSNTKVVRNFKELRPIETSDILIRSSDCLSLCIFSRVTEKKGVGYAIDAVNEVNAFGGEKIKLDIYGPIDEEFSDEFKNKIKNSLTIRYCGIVNPEKSVETLRKYDALLFPTLFRTEGLPGTIIDAYAAGLPIISSKWESFNDIVEDKKTGIGYNFGDYESLVKTLEWAVFHRETLDKMRGNCIRKASEFLPETVMSELLEVL